MKLDENYTLTGKKYNWVLDYEKDTGVVHEKSKSGETIKETETWYFPKVKMALEKYVEEALKAEPTVKKMLKKQEEILETIERLKFNK